MFVNLSRFVFRSRSRGSHTTTAQVEFFAIVFLVYYEKDKETSSWASREAAKPTFE